MLWDILDNFTLQKLGIVGSNESSDYINFFGLIYEVWCLKEYLLVCYVSCSDAISNNQY